MSPKSRKQQPIVAPRFVRIFGGAVSFQWNTKAWTVAIIIFFSLLGVIALNLGAGTLPIPLSQIIHTLLGDPPSAIIHTVIWEFRFPRILTAIYVGFFLSISGLILQSITGNPLADPSLVGVSQGASLAVISLFVVFSDIRIFYAPIAAFLGAATITFIIQFLSFKHSDKNTMRFLLTGIGITTLISALIGVMMTYGRIEKVQSALVWLSGSMHSANWQDVQLLSLLFLATIPFLFWGYRCISAMRFGHEIAISLGLNASKVRLSLIFLSSALAAFAVCTIGPLGFVGLIAPHMARRFVCCGVGMHMIISGLTGAILVAIADYLGRIALAPLQIPAGLVLTVIGVPVFLMLMIRNRA